MKWSYTRVPDCFRCRQFIGWPYCRFYKDGIPWDIQSGANARCPQFQAVAAQHPGLIQRLRTLLTHGSHTRQHKQ